MSHNQRNKAPASKPDPDSKWFPIIISIFTVNGDHAYGGEEEGHSHRARTQGIDPFAGNARDIDEQDIPEYMYQ